MAASLSLADILIVTLALSAILIGLAVAFNEWRAERREDRERAAAHARRRAQRAVAFGRGPSGGAGSPTPADAVAWQACAPVAIDGPSWSACDAGDTSASAGSDGGSCGGGE
ncbi:hypothetical protein [Methylobacterium sp. CCH5-D2]|uniref:hypothetical protein n=1 Tax=Methylobacterium sp. CCH5-D2 TaxID=1768765 RepID=UPI00082B163F|nr:hypothetical protein [Methylobacterium sp. CCH5-D2]